MADTLERFRRMVALMDNAATKGERDTAEAMVIKMSQAIGVEVDYARSLQEQQQRKLPIQKTLTVANRYEVKSPMTRALYMKLFRGIAHAYHVKFDWDVECQFAYCYGYEEDINLVEALYVQLLGKMNSDAYRAIYVRREQDTAGWDGGKVPGREFRRQFYEAFASRIAARLWELRREALEELGEKTSTSTDIMVRDKNQVVGDFYKEKTAHITYTSKKGAEDALASRDADYAPAAQRLGKFSADTANLGGRDNEVGDSGSRAIEST